MKPLRKDLAEKFLKRIKVEARQDHITGKWNLYQDSIVLGYQWRFDSEQEALEKYINNHFETIGDAMDSFVDNTFKTTLYDGDGYWGVDFFNSIEDKLPEDFINQLMEWWLEFVGPMSVWDRRDGE